MHHYVNETRSIDSDGLIYYIKKSVSRKAFNYNEFGIAGLEDKRGKTPAPMRGWALAIFKVEHNSPLQIPC